MTAQDILSEATRRYLTDAEFHARVEVVVRLLEEDLVANTKQLMDREDRSLATMAASAALVTAGVPIQVFTAEWFDPQALERSAAQLSRHLGWSVDEAKRILLRTQEVFRR